MEQLEQRRRSRAGSPSRRPSARLIAVFGKIGLLSFGGPAAQIALMHRVLVDEQRWLDERRFLSALSFCMLLPGPEAMQLATYSGWRLHGVKGGLAAGLLFVAAGRACSCWRCRCSTAPTGRRRLVAALFVGVKAAVLAIVLQALVRVANRAIKGRLDWAVGRRRLRRHLLLQRAVPAGHRRRCRRRLFPALRRRD